MAGDRSRRGPVGRGSSESPKTRAKSGAQRPPPRGSGRAATAGSSSARGTSASAAAATSSRGGTTSRSANAPRPPSPEDSPSNEDGRTTPPVTNQRRVTIGQTTVARLRDMDDSDATSSNEDEVPEDFVLPTRSPPKKKSKKTPAYPKELDGSTLERAKERLKGENHPVDLRIYFSKMKRSDGRPAYTDNENLYVGYRRPNPNPGDDNPEHAPPVIFDPVDAAVALYPSSDNAGSLLTLTSRCGYDALKESVEKLVPDGYELHPDVAIRVPRGQWKRRDGATYCSSNRAAHPTKDFRNIESDGQYLAALVNFSRVYKMRSDDRKLLEASARLDPLSSSDDDDDDEEASRVAVSSREISYRVLELNVGVRLSVQGAKKRSSTSEPTNVKVEVEIGAPVCKVGDGYEVENTRRLGSTLNPMVFSLVDGQHELTVGRLRLEVMNFCHQHIAEYTGKTHRYSGLFLVPKANSKHCVPIRRTEELYSHVENAKRATRVKDDGSTVKCMRFALSLLRPKDAHEAAKVTFSPQSQPSDDDDSLIMSQGTLGRNLASPPSAAQSGVAPARRSASRVVVDNKELVNQLYKNPASPFYHGLTREMVSSLVVLLQSGVARTKYALEREDGSEFPVDDFLEIFQTNEKIAKQCCHLIPTREAYPPDEHGKAPPSKKYAAAEPASMEECVAMVATGINKIADTKVAAAKASAGPQGVSLRRLNNDGTVRPGDPERYDFMFEAFQVKRNDDGTFTDDDPHRFGRRVHYYSKFHPGCSVFQYSAQETQAIEEESAELIFKINPKEEGVELRKTQFEGLSFDQFCRFARSEEDMIPVGVYVKDVVNALAFDVLPEPPSIDDFEF